MLNLVWSNSVFMVAVVLLVGLFIVPKLSKEAIFILTLVVIGGFAYFMGLV